MTAVQVPFSELVRWSSPPPLDEYELDEMSVSEVEHLLRMRFRAFLGRGLDWQEALVCALSPDAG